MAQVPHAAEELNSALKTLAKSRVRKRCRLCGIPHDVDAFYCGVCDREFEVGGLKTPLQLESSTAHIPAPGEL